MDYGVDGQIEKIENILSSLVAQKQVHESANVQLEEHDVCPLSYIHHSIVNELERRSDCRTHGIQQAPSRTYACDGGDPECLP